MKKLLSALLCLGMCFGIAGCSNNSAKSNYEKLIDLGITYSKMPIEFVNSFDAYTLQDKTDGKDISITLYVYPNGKTNLVYSDENESGESLEIAVTDMNIPEEITVDATNLDQVNLKKSFDKWLQHIDLSSKDLMEVYNYLKDK